MIGEVDTGKALTVVERASKALSKAESEAKLKELAEQSKSIVAVTDPASRAVCHESLMTLKNIRIRIQTTGKEAREDATAYSKAVIAEEKRLISLIEPEETRLAGIRDEWDKAKEREREAKIAAEQARVEAIQNRIAEIRSWPIPMTTQPSAAVFQALVKAEAFKVDPAEFEELTQQADEALAISRAALRGILAQRKEHEAKEEQLRKDQEELARHRAEAAERQKAIDAENARKEAEAQAERARQAAAAEAERQATAARIAEENRVERERIAEENRKAKAEREAAAAEDRRIAAEARAKLEADAETQRKANEAETARLAAERAELERQQEAARAAAEAAKPKPRTRGKAPPTKDAIVDVVAKGFFITESEAVGILSLYNWRETAAA